MNSLFKQFGAIFATVVTGACCLGAPILLSALAAMGLGFLINDAVLLPLFYGFLALNLWMLYRRNQVHGSLAPFWLATVGAVLAGITLWTPLSVAIFAGILLILAASVWDFVLTRRQRCAKAC